MVNNSLDIAQFEYSDTLQDREFYEDKEAWFRDQMQDEVEKQDPFEENNDIIE